MKVSDNMLKRKKQLNQKEKIDEFFEIINDILSNVEYAKLAEFKHHNKDILYHNLLVAWITYKSSKFFGMDCVSATRGAMLHDFFHYEWREVKESFWDRSHGKAHPFISYENATRHFEVNEVEKDIIVKHMFPITPSLPKYRESFLVSCVDKVVAAIEFMCLEERFLQAVEA